MNKLLPILFLTILAVSSCAGKGAKKDAPVKKENAQQGGIAKFEFPAERNMKVAGTCGDTIPNKTGPSIFQEITFFEPKLLFYWDSDTEYDGVARPYTGSNFLEGTPTNNLKNEFQPGVLLAGFHSGNFKAGTFKGQQYWLVYAETIISDDFYDGETFGAFFRFAFDPKAKLLTALPSLNYGITNELGKHIAGAPTVLDSNRIIDNSDKPEPAVKPLRENATEEEKRAFSLLFARPKSDKSELATNAIQTALKHHLNSNLKFQTDYNYNLREFGVPPVCILAGGIALKRTWPNDEFSGKEQFKLSDPILKQEFWGTKALPKENVRYMETPYFGKVFGAGYKWSAYLPDGEVIEYRWTQPEEVNVKIGQSPEVQPYSCFMPGGKRSDPEPITVSNFTNAKIERPTKRDLIKVGESIEAGDVFKIHRTEENDAEYRLYKSVYKMASGSRNSNDEDDNEDKTARPEQSDAADTVEPITIDDVAIGDTHGAFSYSEFTKFNPYVNVRSPFGDFFECRKKQYFSTERWVEPLVYLYSDKRKTFRVNLPQNVHLVDTKPIATDRGWNVTTNQNGTLSLLESNETVPYLFWEGEVPGRASNKSGFVISARDSLGFFKGKLKFLGLSDKEIADFTEFWEDNLHFAPYYYVRFLDQSEIEKRAPLIVTPAPQTRIRISIVISPSNVPFKVLMQKLTPGPARRGDTLVEWGVIPD